MQLEAGWYDQTIIPEEGSCLAQEHPGFFLLYGYRNIRISMIAIRSGTHQHKFRWYMLH
jgi:hypothetical protein